MAKKNKMVQIPDREKIDVFRNTVEELKSRRFYPDGLNAFNFTIRFDKDTQKVVTTIKEGDLDDFRSLLTTFRQFILEGEPSNVYKILKICRRYVKPEATDFIEFLDASKNIWKEIYEQGIVKMKRGKLDLSPR